MDGIPWETPRVFPSGRPQNVGSAATVEELPAVPPAVEPGDEADEASGERPAELPAGELPAGELPAGELPAGEPSEDRRWPGTDPVGLELGPSWP